MKTEININLKNIVSNEIDLINLIRIRFPLKIKKIRKNEINLISNIIFIKKWNTILINT